ncbi:MAG: NAD(P)/FAD-dependent oxidoreductase [Planctomycetes bacterium]|nr:NAD(P)/FAD-dependent oxidoreductase [Planctomycetota bacterium]
MDDAIVIGSGPNGLVAAATLARAGWRVRVLEAQDRPGGAVYSLETTLPGFIHDVGAAFFPFAHVSPALLSLDLGEVGLQWRGGIYESAHPAPDGTCASIARDVERAARSFGIDGDAWRALHDWQARMGPRLAETLLAPLPSVRPPLRLGLTNLLGLAMAGLSTSAGYARRRFQTEAARRVIPGLALHVDLGPEDFSGAALGLVLALLAAGGGFQVPVGGARSITHALLRRLENDGGTLQLNTHVREIVVRQRRAVAVRTDQGDEIPARSAILADVGAPALFWRMLAQDDVPGYLREAMHQFRYGWGTFKMDWALGGPVPWMHEEPRQAAVVHAGDSVDDLIRFTKEARAGEIPSHPYLVIGQQSLLDPTRAPEGKHTLWAYSRVPSYPEGGWQQHRERFADVIEERIEGLAPGFRKLIQGRAIFSPADLEAMNENLVGGDLGGGSAQFSHQLFWRPAFPYFRHRTPVKGLYLASASCHPGAGVHGACGFNAANQALRDAV